MQVPHRTVYFCHTEKDFKLYLKMVHVDQVYYFNLTPVDSAVVWDSDVLSPHILGTWCYMWHIHLLSQSQLSACFTLG